MWLPEKKKTTTTQKSEKAHTQDISVYTREPKERWRFLLCMCLSLVPPQLLALKKMPVVGGSHRKGSTRLLYRELKRFTQFFWGPEPIFFLFWHYPQCVCPKDKQRRLPPQLYLLKGKHSCLSCILRRNMNEGDQTKISKGRKVFTA